MKRKDDIDELLEDEALEEKREKKKNRKKKKSGNGAKFSIFAKILIVALLCMAVPLIIVVSYSTNKNGDTINDTGAESLRNLSTAQADALDQFITAQKGIVCSIANNGQIAALCRDTEDASAIDTTERDKMSEYLIKIHFLPL